MRYRIVSTCERPDLAVTTATWRWSGFFRERGVPVEEVIRYERDHLVAGSPMLRTLVLLAEGEPVGMVSLLSNDLEGRPDLGPWLGDLFVDARFRGCGHALRLIAALEASARAEGVERLWLYTEDAAGLYRKAGWSEVEAAVSGGKPVRVLYRDLEREGP